MNIKDSNKHFDKLTSFYAQVSNDGEVNKIELDLLKSYVLNFYESITEPLSVDTPSAPVVNHVTEKVALPVEEPIATVESTPVSAPVSPVSAPVAEKAPSEVVIPADEPTAPAAVANNSSELDALFSLETGNEISDKLSMSPIKDVTKAMNINEKIFTIKELFGGNQEKFDSTMNKLNDLSSYEEATAYLGQEVVEANGWLDASKSKKVKTFLKLIARKYI